MTDWQKEALTTAIYDFAMRVLAGNGSAEEINMLPNLLAVTHVMTD